MHFQFLNEGSDWIVILTISQYCLYNNSRKVCREAYTVRNSSGYITVIIVPRLVRSKGCVHVLQHTKTCLAKCEQHVLLSTLVPHYWSYSYVTVLVDCNVDECCDLLEQECLVPQI